MRFQGGIHIQRRLWMRLQGVFQRVLRGTPKGTSEGLGKALIDKLRSRSGLDQFWFSLSKAQISFFKAWFWRRTTCYGLYLEMGLILDLGLGMVLGGLSLILIITMKQILFDSLDNLWIRMFGCGLASLYYLSLFSWFYHQGSTRKFNQE